MARQKITPAYLPANGRPTATLMQSALREADIQALIHEHPEILPIGQIDPAFEGAVSICREFSTPSGRIDNLLLTPSGLPVVVECKLWRNPEARRKVVGQVLEYARDLSRFSSAGIQAQASAKGVPSLYDHVCNGNPSVDEATFHDNLSLSLARGRFLLLIVGDGISGSVETIFEQLSRNATLHFSFGLVEMPIFELPDGGQLAVPRVVARTGIDVRRVIELPEGYGFEEPSEGDDETDEGGAINTSRAVGQEARVRFWSEFLSILKLDDPEQPLPKPNSRGSLTFTLPVPGYNSWLTAWRSPSAGEVGVFLSFRKGSIGQRVAQSLVDNSEEPILTELGDTANIGDKDGTPVFRDRRVFGDLSDTETGRAAQVWLADRVNRFVNVLRPAVRSAAADLEEE